MSDMRLWTILNKCGDPSAYYVNPNRSAVIWRFVWNMELGDEIPKRRPWKPSAEMKRRVANAWRRCKRKYGVSVVPLVCRMEADNAD